MLLLCRVVERWTPNTDSASFLLLSSSNYAIYLDKSLRFGSSGACDTFMSPILSGSEQFHVRRLEVWGMNS